MNPLLALGYAVLAFHVGAISYGSFVGLTDDSSGAYDASAGPMSMMLSSTVLAPLIGGVLLFLGELGRRGGVAANVHARRDTLLPQGSNASTWRMVAPGWNLTWAALCAVVATVLMVGASDPWAGHETPMGSVLWLVWSINALLLAGFAGQNLGTWLKKRTWAKRSEAALFAERAVRAGAPVLRVPITAAPSEHLHPAERLHAAEMAAESRARRAVTPEEKTRARWRSFSFRWRFDVWLCALGAVCLVMVPMWLSLSAALPGSEDSVALLVGALGVAGAAMLGAGLWATTQFWRAGEDLAAGESVA